MSTFIPTRMQAVLVEENGGSLTVDQIPTPQPGPGQVLIRMAAAPINPSDLGFIKGSYGFQKDYPVIPGFEGSGIVVAAGPGLLPHLLVGKRVTCSAVHGGTWAEYLAIPATACFPLIKNLSLEQGSMLIVNPLTAIAFFEIAKRGKHAAIINNAAAGALGRMILRLGQREHVPIIHIVRRQAQIGLLRSLGAQYILNNTDPDFYTELRQLAQQLKATLILDPVGGEQTPRLLAAAPNESTIVAYGSLSGRKSDIASGISNDPSKHIVHFYMPDWLAKKNLLQVLWKLKQVQWLAVKQLQTVIQKRFFLWEVQQALKLYQTNPTAGKVLLLADLQKT